MLTILWYLLIAWILQLFGYSSLIIEGVEIFSGIQIGMSGYYFIFAVIGMLRVIFSRNVTINRE